MGYIEAAKLLAILGIITALCLWQQRIGYNNCKGKWDAEKVMQQEVILKANEQAKKETLKSVQLAQSIEVMKHDSDAQIQALLDDIDKLSRDKRMQRRTVCTHPGGLPKDNSTGLSADAAAADGLTEEFQRFLLSSLRRGDDAGHYARIAHEWAKELCTAPNVVCPNTSTDKPMEPAQ